MAPRGVPFGTPIFRLLGMSAWLLRQARRRRGVGDRLEIASWIRTPVGSIDVIAVVTARYFLPMDLAG
jgi:hypothetical protein